MDLNRKSVSYTVLEREAQSNRQVYDALIQRKNVPLGGIERAPVLSRTTSIELTNCLPESCC